MAGENRGALGNRTHGEALPRERRALACERPGMGPWEAKALRQGASPASALAFDEFEQAIDVRSVLATGASSDPGAFAFGVGAGLEVGRCRRTDPRARLVHVPGEDWMPYAGDVDVLLGEVEWFVRSGARWRRQRSSGC